MSEGPGGNEIDLSLGLDVSPAVDSAAVFQRSMDDVVASAGQMATTMGAAVKKLNEEFSAGLGKTQKQVKDVASATDSAVKKTKELAQAQGMLGGVFGRIGSAIQQLRGWLLGLFAGFSFAAIVHEVASFEKAMAGVRKELTGSAGLETSMAMITAKAKEMGVTTVFSAVESAHAMEILVDAGATAQETLSTVSHAADLAAAGSMSLAAATTVITQTAKQFNLSLGESAKIVNTLAAADLETNASIAILAQGLRLTGANAKAMNLSMQDSVLAIAGLSEAGYVGRRALGAMMGVMSGLSKPTKALSAELYKLGVDTATWADKLADPSVGLIGVLTELESKAVKGQAAISLFGNQGGEAISKLIAMLPRLKHVADAFEDPAKGAKALAEIMENNLHTAFEKLSNSARGLLLYLGTSNGGFSMALTAVVTGINDFIKGLVGINSYISQTSGEITKLNKVGAFLRDNVDLLIAAVASLAGMLLGRYLRALTASIKTSWEATRASFALGAAKKAEAASMDNVARAATSEAAAVAKAAGASTGAAGAAVAATAATGAWGVAVRATTAALGGLRIGASLLLELLGGWPGLVITIVAGLWAWVAANEGVKNSLSDIENTARAMDLTAILDMHPAQQAQELIKVTALKVDAQAAMTDSMNNLKKLKRQFDYYKNLPSVGPNDERETNMRRLKAVGEREQQELAYYKTIVELTAKQEAIVKGIIDGRIKGIEELTAVTHALNIARDSAFKPVEEEKPRFGTDETSLARQMRQELNPRLDALRRKDKDIADLEAIKKKLKEDEAKGIPQQTGFDFTSDEIDGYIRKRTLAYEDLVRSLDDVRQYTKEYAAALGDLGGRISPVEAITRKYADQEEALRIAQANGGAGRERLLSDLDKLHEAYRQDVAIARDVASGVDGVVASNTQLISVLERGKDLSDGQRDQVLKMAEAYNPMVRQIQRSTSELEVLEAEFKRAEGDSDFRARLALSGGSLETLSEQIAQAKIGLDALKAAYKDFGRTAGIVAATFPEIAQKVSIEANILQLEEQLKRTDLTAAAITMLNIVLRDQKQALEDVNKAMAEGHGAGAALVRGLDQEAESVKNLYRQREALIRLQSDPQAMADQMVSQDALFRAMKKNEEQILAAQAALSGFPSMAQNVADAMRGIWEGIGKDLNDAITGLILSALNGFSDFKTKLRNMFKGLAAQLVSLWVQNKIIVPVIAQISGFMGAGGSTRLWGSAEEAIRNSTSGSQQSSGAAQASNLGNGPGGPALTGLAGVIDKVFNHGFIGALKDVVKGLFGFGGVKEIIKPTKTAEQIAKEALDKKYDSPAKIVEATQEANRLGSEAGAESGVIKGLAAAMPHLEEVLVTGKSYKGGLSLEQAAENDVINSIRELTTGDQFIISMNQLNDSLVGAIGGLNESLLASSRQLAREQQAAVISPDSGKFDLNTILGGLEHGVDGLLGGVTNAIKANSEDFSFSGLLDGVTAKISKGWESVTDIFKGKGAVSGITDAFKGKGSIDGVAGSLNAIGTAVGSITGNNNVSDVTTKVAAVAGAYKASVGIFAAIKDFGSFATGFKAAFTGVTPGNASAIQGIGASGGTAANSFNFGSSVAGVAGGVAGGVIGTKIGNGFGTEKNTAILTTAGAIIGSILPGIGTAAGAFVGAIVGGVVSGALGGRKKVTGQGVSFDLGPGGTVDSEAYQYVKKAKSFFRGYGSPKYTVVDEMTDTDNALSVGVGSIYGSLGAFTKTQDELDKLSDIFSKLTTDKLDINTNTLGQLAAAERTAAYRAKNAAPIIAKYDLDGSGSLSRAEERAMQRTRGGAADARRLSQINRYSSPVTDADKNADMGALVATWFQGIAVNAIKAAEPIIGAASDRFLKLLGNFAGDVGRFVDGFAASVALEAGLKLNIKDEAQKLKDEKQRNALEAVQFQRTEVDKLFNNKFSPRDILEPTKVELDALAKELETIGTKGGELSAAGTEVQARVAAFEANKLQVKAAAAIFDARDWEVVPEKLAGLAAALLELKGAAVGLILAFDDAHKNLTEMLTNASDRIFESGLSPEALYSRRKDQFADIMTQLQTAQSPDEIVRLTEQGTSILNDAFFNMLDQFQQDDLRGEFLKAIDDLQVLVDDRISVGTAIAENISVSLDSAITDKIISAADQQMAASASFNGAVSSFGQWVTALKQGGFTVVATPNSDRVPTPGIPTGTSELVLS